MHWGRSGEAVTGGKAAAHIDEVVVARLVDDLGADHAAEVCALFLADARERVQAVRTACAAGDADAAARSAHRLKSSSGFVGAGGVSTLCREIEDLARRDLLDEVPRCVELVSHELEQASGELGTLIGRHLRSG